MTRLIRYRLLGVMLIGVCILSLLQGCIHQKNIVDVEQNHIPEELQQSIPELVTTPSIDEPVIEEEPEPEPEPVEITISFAGDTTIGYDDSRGYEWSFAQEVERQGDYGYFFRNIKDIFEKDDLTLVNLETTLTTATERADKTFCFKGDPEWVNILLEGSVEAVNISNNHIYDYLEQGFNDTIKVLEDAGILYSGEGHVARFEIKGVKISSLGFTGWGTWDKERIGEKIRQEAEEADIVIVSFHWGKERSHYPNKVQMELGRWSIDNGASVVVGHHPHVIQGIEKYKDRYIVYSLANWSFGGNRNPKYKDTFIFQNTFKVVPEEGVKESQGNIIPCSISSANERNNYQPTPLEGEEKERVLQDIYKFSEILEYGITRE